MPSDLERLLQAIIQPKRTGNPVLQGLSSARYEALGRMLPDYSLSGLTFRAHYDGTWPYNTDFSGDPDGDPGGLATVSGGVIYRPGKYGKAVQVADAATNKILNPSVEVDLTNITNSGGQPGTIERISTDAYTGGACLKWTPSAGDCWVRFNCDAAVSGSTSYTFQARMKGKVGNVAYLQPWDGSERAGVSVTFDGTWQQVTLTYVTVSSPSTLGVFFRRAGTATDPIYLDAVQVEQKSYATPYCDGSLGAGHSWSGTAHASTSSRTAATLTYPTAGNIALSAGTVMAWTSLASFYSYQTHFCAKQGVFDLYSYSSGGVPYFCFETNAGAGSICSNNVTTLIPGIPFHWAVTWDQASATTRLYINGAKVGETTSGSYTASLSPSMYIGLSEGAYYWINGLVDELLILDHALTPAEVAAYYAAASPIVGPRTETPANKWDISRWGEAVWG